MLTPDFDLVGSGSVEREVQFLIDDGTIELETENQVFRFRKNMSSCGRGKLLKKNRRTLGKKIHKQRRRSSLRAEIKF